MTHAMYALCDAALPGVEVAGYSFPIELVAGLVVGIALVAVIIIVRTFGRRRRSGSGLQGGGSSGPKHLKR